jgi:hypothetical protein
LEVEMAEGLILEERLGRALGEGGVTEPPARVEWLDLAAAHHPGG